MENKTLNLIYSEYQMDALKNMKCHTDILLMFDTYITICANILKFVESEILFTWKALDIFLMCKRCGPDFLKDFFFYVYFFILYYLETFNRMAYVRDW